MQRKLKSAILELLKVFRIVAIYRPKRSGKITPQKLIAKNKKIKYYAF